MEKYFSVNESGCSIRCKIYQNEGIRPTRVILFGHGFGGHKDNRAAARFAGKYLSKRKDAAVITFDLPCHGTDARKKLVFADCAMYIDLMRAWIDSKYQAPDVCVYATSFGGFVFLDYIRRSGNPFRRIALRCPAVKMYEALTTGILTDENRQMLEKGKPVLAGFDRKIQIDGAFLQDLKAADLSGFDFSVFTDELLLLHGTKDEVIPYETVREFAEENVLELLTVENADHRFTDPKLMDYAIHEIICFFEG